MGSGAVAGIISEIFNAQRAITAGTTLHLGRYLGTSPEFWFNLRSHYALEMEQKRLAVWLDEEGEVLAVA